MRIFHCDHCQKLLFFENVECLACGHALAYLPDLGEITSLDSIGNGVWRSPLPVARGRTYRLCENYTLHNVCNWGLAADSPESLCVSCRLTQIIPDLDQPGNKEAWYKTAVAQRRLVYSLLELNLPLTNKAEDPQRGLAFEFRADTSETGGEKVLTGHSDGVITINIAEADDAEREKRRVNLHEPYRTLLGHFRHEVGHYYWDRLIADGPLLSDFRRLFGDERADYAATLERHYNEGAPADWQQRFVSSYASSHPWEDWAETWAHYIHMTDTIETAVTCGLALRPRRRDEPSLETDPRRGAPDSFAALIEEWLALTYVLNNLNRGLGQPDGYPVVLSPPAIDKLLFVHDTVAANRGRT